jgi:hypothetical protein
MASGLDAIVTAALSTGTTSTRKQHAVDAERNM